MEQRAEKKIYMEKLGKRAVSAKETVTFLNVIQRQEGLILAADALVAQQAYIIEENHFGQVIQQALMRMPTAAIDQTMRHISGPTLSRSVTMQSGV